MRSPIKRRGAQAPERLPAMKKKNVLTTTQTIMLAFLAAIAVGSLLLALPVSAADGSAVPYIDALFTATTSVCVTGLVTLPTVSTWSVFGQIVILLLIQVGGNDLPGHGAVKCPPDFNMFISGSAYTDDQAYDYKNQTA